MLSARVGRGLARRAPVLSSPARSRGTPAPARIFSKNAAGHDFGRVRVHGAPGPLLQRQASSQPSSAQSVPATTATTTPASIAADSCTPERASLLRARFDEATGWARIATQRVDEFLATAAPEVEPKLAGVRSALDRYFFRPKPGAELPLAEKQKKAQIVRDTLDTLSQPATQANLGCATPDAPQCTVANAFTNRGRRQVLCCEPYFAESAPRQTFILLHELLHASGELPDRAYGFERLFVHLDVDRALDNSDSYALFAAEAATGFAGGVESLRHVRTSDEDDVSDCDPAQREMAHRDLAHVERMASNAVQVVNYLDFLPETFEKHFQSRDPREHAIVVERFQELTQALSGRIQLECETRCREIRGYARAWFGSTLHLCPLYFAGATPEWREDKLFALVAAELLGLGTRLSPDDERFATQSSRRAVKNPFAYAAYAREATAYVDRPPRRRP